MCSSVKLAWKGYIETKDGRAARLVLSAHGTEKLEFSKDDHPLKKTRMDEVSILPASPRSCLSLDLATTPSIWFFGWTEKSLSGLFIAARKPVLNS